MFINSDEARKVKEAIAEINKDSARAWQIACTTGLRRAEIGDLTFNDIDEDQGKHWVDVRHGKGDKHRQTPISRDLAIQIDTIKESQNKRHNDAVVPHSMRTVSRHLNKACAGLTKVNPDYDFITLHDARRHFIKRMLENDIPPLLVMQYSGHQSFRVFRDHYLNKYSRRFEVEKLDNVDGY